MSTIPPPPLPALDAALLGALLEPLAAQVLAVDAEDHHCIYANRAARDFYGMGSGAVAGRSLAGLVGAAAYAAYLPYLAAQPQAEPSHWQGWVDSPVHGRRYLHETLVPYPQTLLLYGQDHTDLKQREEELAENRQHLQASEALKSAIVDYALAALVSTDAAGQIVEFNPAAEAMTGFQRNQVIGRNVSQVIMPQRFRAAHQAGMQRMQQGGEGRVLGKRLELFALRADGSEFPMEMVLWRTHVGSSVFYTASMTDVSERHQAQQQIEAQREALRQSEKLNAMGSLLAGVAHELNNPLAIVMGRAGLLEDKCESVHSLSAAELKADTQHIREAAERCGRIVRTFLNLARSRPPQASSLHLNALVQSAVDLLRYGYRSHGITLEVLLADGMPPVRADGDQIGQIVMNLLVNAQQAVADQPGERVVQVHTGVEPPRSHRPPRVWLRVRDNGPGVADAARAQVFEQFFTTKPEGVGTGLGLAVSRALAREHGGELVLEPALPGLGAGFRLSLPIEGAEALHADSATLDAGDEPAADYAPATARVLVVDDEADLADLMRDMLEGVGLEVATAESGAVALELLASARFDAIVSDLRMPDMDGPTLWSQVSALYPGLAQRMLFVTGDTLSASARAFLKRTAISSLDKPFSMADLVAKVQALLV